MVLNEDWTAEAVGTMHKFRIKNIDLAEACGYSPGYIATVLNGNKHFERPEAAEKTREKILAALEGLKDQRMREVEADGHGED